MPFHINPIDGEFEVVDDKGKSYGVHKTRQQAIDQQHALYAALPEASKKEAAEVTEKASDNPGDYLIVEDREKPTTWHLQVRKNGKPDHGLMGGAWAALHEGYRGNKYEGPNKGEAISKLKKLYDAEKMDTPATKEANEPSALDRIKDFFTGAKEGRRHSSTDQDAIQQIHDLSTKAGADCSLMVKEVNGKSRWVLLSSNAYEDRDHEWVSLKAQKRDVKRMTDTKQYGPLRLWHLGYPDVEKKEAGPGLDIGDCDYADMIDGFRVESGTFRNERVAAAIKERSDQWAVSVGFFHPTDQPDPSGVYHEMHTFERSLLPRTKAANNLTPLAAIMKEMNSMTTKEEKLAGLSKLFDNDPAVVELVTKALDTSKKEAEQRGLTLKQEKDAPAAPETAKAEKAADPFEGDDLSDLDEATLKSYKAMAPHIVKAIHNLTKKANMIGDGDEPDEDDMKKAKKAAKKEKKERKAIEARLKEVDDMKAKIDQIAAAVAELNGDMPRALQGGFRATQSDSNLLEMLPALKQGATPDPLGAFMDQMFKFNSQNGGG